jgi:hypothetical protein
MRPPLRYATRLGIWTSARPGPSILLAGTIGLVTAGFITHAVSEACFDATSQWDPNTKRWQPGIAPLFWGLFRISAELCREATKTPPWILISGMIAAPSVLLTWYWRDKKRRDDHRMAVESHRLALESGIAARYKEAAQLLASEDPTAPSSAAQTSAAQTSPTRRSPTRSTTARRGFRPTSVTERRAG